MDGIIYSFAAKLTSETDLSSNRVSHLNFGSILIKKQLTMKRNLPLTQSAAVSRGKEWKQSTIQDVKQKETPGAGNQHG